MDAPTKAIEIKAAISAIDVHSATILSEDGRIVKNDGYRHGSR